MKSEGLIQDMTAGRDPHAYLERIRVGGAVGPDGQGPSLALLRTLHEAHMLAVPFENLSIHYGEPITLEDETLFDKIVRRRRGGFCYELNGLFAWLLRWLGFEVTMLSARVARGDGEFTPEFDHMTLLVHELEGADWLADVGFGDSFRRPLRLQPEIEQDGGDRKKYRLRFNAEEATWLMQQHGETGWAAQYRFTPRPHPIGDFAERCVYQQTSPDSHFTQKRICSLALPDGRITLSERRLIATLQGVREERELASEEEYRAVLAERFGIALRAQPAAGHAY